MCVLADMSMVFAGRHGYWDNDGVKKENDTSMVTYTHQKALICIGWIERLAQACAKSCIATSSFRGGFGPGGGRSREGYGYLLFGWFGCAGIHFRCAGVFEFP